MISPTLERSASGRKRNSSQMSGTPTMNAASPMMAGGGQIQMPPNPLQQQHNMFLPTSQPPHYGDTLMGGLSASDPNGMMGVNGGFANNGLVNGTGYRAQSHAMANGMTVTAESGNQIALRNRFPQQVMRLNPTYQYGAQQMTADQTGLAMNGDSAAAVSGAMMGGMVDEQAELQARIRKMKGKKANIPPFVQKLSQFVNDPKCDHLIRWSDSGESFLVLDEDEFSKTLIPDLFKHNNYASFVRQLNMYGFHKVVGLADGSLKTSEQRSKPPSEYQNPYFKRGMPDLMWLIQKPKNNSKRKKGKKTKAEAESEEEDTSEGNADDVASVPHGNLLEGPSTMQQQQPGSGKLDLSNITHQLEALRNHQALISMAISKLKREHTQLYEQSRTFQTLHDRHEATINAILSFLASVYDKGLGGHIGGALANLFSSSAVADAIPRNPDSGTVIGSPVAGARNLNGTPNRMKRRPLLLENGPTSGSGSQSFVSSAETPSPRLQDAQLNQYISTYHSPTTELFEEDELHELQPDSNSPQLSRDSIDGTVMSNNSFRSPLQNINRPLASPLQRSSSLTPRLPQRSITPMTASNNQAQSLLQSGKDVLEKHQELIRQKSDEISHLETLQQSQDENIRQLVEHLMQANRNGSGSNSGTPAGATPQSTNGLIGNGAGDMGHILGNVEGYDNSLDLSSYIDNDLFSSSTGMPGAGDFDATELDGELFNTSGMQGGDLGADSFASFHGLDGAHNSGTSNPNPSAPASPENPAEPLPVLEMDALSIPEAKRRKVAVS